MPTYDYLCQSCGPFQARAAMADFDKPKECPDCGAISARALLSAPVIAQMDGARRHAITTNERSADSPRRSSHGPGCGCCGGGGKARQSGTLHHPGGAKSFPAKRPWMISH